MHQAWLGLGALLGLTAHQRRLAYALFEKRSEPGAAAACARWAMRAAQRGDPDAQCLLAKLYIAGLGVSKDHDAAFRWFQQAAATGHTDGEHSLGWCYEQGVGTPAEPSKAFEWWLKSAAKGEGQSMLGLAHCLWTGVGAERDPVAALDWAQLALLREALGARELVDEILAAR